MLTSVALIQLLNLYFESSYIYKQIFHNDCTHLKGYWYQMPIDNYNR